MVFCKFTDYSRSEITQIQRLENGIKKMQD